MTEVRNDPSTVENQRFLQEAITTKTSEEIDNPALQRCLEQPFNPEKDARQAYDRMYHTHNRS